MATLAQLLYPQVIFESVTTRVKPLNNTLQRFWGVELGTANKEDIQGRVGTYDIFDSVRDIATFRAPMTGPKTLPAQAVNQQPVTCVRIHEKMPLLYERIYPIRKLGRPSTDIDPGGASYVQRQQGILRTRFDNAREVLMSMMMQDSGQVLISGEDWIPVFSGGTFSISWQIPAANKNQVSGSISSTWLNTTNATIFEDVLAVDNYFQAQHGWPLRHIWVNAITWGYVTNNAGLKSRGGSSNMVFTKFEKLGQVGSGEKTEPEYIAEIKCLPGIVWHIYNGQLNVNGSLTKLIPDNMAIFCVEPDPMIVSMVQGTEYVQENEMQPAQEQRGPYFWSQYVREPAKVEVVGLDVCMPALRVPKTIAPATVIF